MDRRKDWERNGERKRQAKVKRKNEERTGEDAIEEEKGGKDPEKHDMLMAAMGLPLGKVFMATPLDRHLAFSCFSRERQEKRNSRK